LTRVLFLTESFHPVLGGGEKHIRALGSALASAGHSVSVVTRQSEAGWPAEELLDGMRVFRVPPAGAARTGKYRMVPAAMRTLIRERAAFDLLVVRGTRVLGLPGILVARALGKAVVLQAEINGEMSGQAYTWGTRFEGGTVAQLVRAGVRVRNLLLRDADGFVAMSRAIRSEFEAAGVRPTKIAHIAHGVDRARYRPADPAEKAALRARLGLPEGADIVCYTGRLLRGKGLETLVDAFARVAVRRPKAHLLLVGSGEGQALSVEAELRERVECQGLATRVSFAGRVDAVEDHLRACDVFAFPSVYEALGISLIEAGSCGLPAVGSRTGGIVDVIEEGESGFLVEPGSVEGLGAALERLLADEGLRLRMGRQAVQFAALRFDFASTVVRYRSFFAEASRRASR
jgi:glycosyltransferase involved in cell wall biosynthesis